MKTEIKWAHIPTVAENCSVDTVKVVSVLAVDHLIRSQTGEYEELKKAEKSNNISGLINYGCESSLGYN